MHTRRNTAGFTLVELMITVSVIGIMGLVAVPGMLSFLPQYRVNAATRVLASETNLARMLAISKNNVYLMEFDETNQQILVKEDDGTTVTTVKTIAFSSEFDGVTLGFKTGAVGIDGAAISQAAAFGTTASDEAEFRPNGMLSGAGVFYLIPEADLTTRVDRMRAIEVGRAGQVALHQYDSSASPPWKEI